MSAEAKPSDEFTPCVFTHRARLPWTFDPTRTYEQRPSNKPRGLWLSVDGDWERWLAEDYQMDEECHWWTLAATFDVDRSRLLNITDVAAIDQFQQAFVVQNAPEFYGKPDGYRVNWSALVGSFAGIIIAPYLWERRLDGDASSWYYGWDCASACVWDLTAVSVLEHSHVG